MLLLKALIAFGIALLETITSKYSRTIRLLWNRSVALWAYPLIYGLISIVLTFLYVPLVRAGIPPLLVLMPAGLKVEVGDAESATPTFLVAVVLGFTTKALLHLRLFNVNWAGSEIPFGTEMIVQPIERSLLRTIAIDEFNAVAAFLRKRAERYNDLADVKNMIKEDLPGTTTLPENERKALEVELDEATGVRAAMEIYLRAFSVRALDRVFPEKRRR